jgi:hypothetical protein
LDEFSETLTNGIRVNHPYVLENNPNHVVMQTATKMTTGGDSWMESDIGVGGGDGIGLD